MSDIVIEGAFMPRISNLNSPTNVWSQGTFRLKVFLSVKFIQVAFLTHPQLLVL